MVRSDAILCCPHKTRMHNHELSGPYKRCTSRAVVHIPLAARPAGPRGPPNLQNQYHARHCVLPFAFLSLLAAMLEYIYICRHGFR